MPAVRVRAACEADSRVDVGASIVVTMPIYPLSRGLKRRRARAFAP